MVPGVQVNYLKKFTYLRPVRIVARRLGLQFLLRQLYFLWARPRDGVLNVTVAGVTVKFKPQTPEELRMLEGLDGEKHLLELMTRTLKPGDVAWDIGSNVGLFTVFMAQAVGTQGRVVAFEPEEKSYAHLLINLQVNNLQDVCALRQALGESNSHAILHIGEGKGDFSLSHLQTKETSRQVVEVVRGDYLIERENLPIPNIVKIDVEGFELAVIRGLARALSHTSCRMVCCEIHPTLLPPGVRGADVLDALRKLGFQHIETMPRGDTLHAICHRNR